MNSGRRVKIQGIDIEYLKEELKQQRNMKIQKKHNNMSRPQQGKNKNKIAKDKAI